MKRSHVMISALCFSILLAGPRAVSARPRPSRTTQQRTSCTPDTVTSPIVSTAPLAICVSGFATGNFVSIVVPWVGTPDFHSTYTHSEYVGDSGGFCYNAPPSWATMVLTPGSYTVQTLWSRDGAQSLRPGPGATLTVAAP